MTARRSPPERLAVLEQQVSHMEAELDRMSAKVDEMHAILLQARGVRWAIIALAGPAPLGASVTVAMAADPFKLTCCGLTVSVYPTITFGL